MKLERDAVDDPLLHEALEHVDVLSPWSVGRCRDREGIETLARDVWRDDLTWCRERGVDYLPVVFPGFSWHNLRSQSPLGDIPRDHGAFLWEQYVQLRKLGVRSAYQAMFDEVDEGTAVFKCTNDPPVGASAFLDFEGEKSDRYLQLVGAGGELLRAEVPLSETPPPAP